MGAQVLEVHPLGLRRGAEKARGAGGVEALLGRDAQERRGLADVHALAEVGAEQRVHQGFHRAVLARRPAQQPVRVHALRDAADEVEAERDALAAAEFGDAVVQPPRPVLAAELAQQPVLARHAARRDVGVEQEGPPRQVDLQVRPRREHAQQPPDAEEAPRADQVEDDLDAQPGPGRGKDVHG